jgi:hypothetical protein
VRVRIVKPPPSVFEGISLRLYRVGSVYEITPTLGNYLVAEGYAQIELRENRSSDLRPVERRKKR